MRESVQRLLLVLLGLLLLGALGMALATWTNRWPKVRQGFMRLGDAAITFALGFMGFVIVVLVLRALGWLPPPN